MARGPTVFLSYAHVDEVWKDRVRTHLRVLELEGDLEIWDDRRIGWGDDWFDRIRSTLEEATLAILLVSPDFLASDFIRRQEVPALLARREHEGLVVLPLLVRACAWQVVPWLSRSQLRPRDARALATLDPGAVDQVLADLALELREVAAGRAEPVGAPLPEPVEPAPARPPPRVGAVPTPAPVAEERLLWRGNASEVRLRELPDGSARVVKSTTRSGIDVAALRELATLRPPNVVVPSSVRVEGESVIEELPYVPGVTLSVAAAPGVGGLAGRALRAFAEQLLAGLSELHAARLVHGDVHPDNIICAVRWLPAGEAAEVSRRTDSRRWLSGAGAGATAGAGAGDGGGEDDRRRIGDPFDRWLGDAVLLPGPQGRAVAARPGGHPDPPISAGARPMLTFALVDGTTCARAGAEGGTAVRHGSYTAPEQRAGTCVPGSDMYALAATIVYGISGRVVPDDPATWLEEIEQLARRAGHGSREFGGFVRACLDPDDRARPRAGVSLSEDSIVRNFGGLLDLGEAGVLLSTTFDVTLLDDGGALQALRSLPLHDDARRHWTDLLTTRLST